MNRTGSRYRRPGGLASLAIVSILAGCVGGSEQPGKPLLEAAEGSSAAAPADELLAPVISRWKGDLPGIRERRLLRVLVSYSPTRFTIVQGQRKGFEAEMMHRFDDFLNEGRPRGEKIEVVYLPVPFGELLPSLLDGRGDIVAAGLTITPERSRQVAFSDPYQTGISEVVVTHGDRPDLRDLRDLAGERVDVVQGSSWAESLRRFNGSLKAEGLPPVDLQEMDPYLEVHDLLELVNAGVLEMTVADRHEAGLWAEVLPDIRVRDDLALATDLELGWATRPDSPQLLGALDEFVRTHQKGTLMGNMLFKRYFGNTKLLRNPLSGEEKARMERLRPLFEEYGERYDIPWLLLAAQGFQESGLDQSKQSRAGAIGIMQLKPSTAADKNVGIPDISTERNNIHAGARYLAYLRDTYFDEPDIEPLPRLHLALAAYNAGPNRVRQLRAETQRRGLDPDRWFFNVERVALEVVGSEPVRYVANIHRYYVAYRLAMEVQVRRDAVRAGL